MLTIYDDTGLKISPTISLSKRERELALRLLNKDISSPESDENIISQLSNNTNILINRANCGLGSPLGYLEWNIHPRESTVKTIKYECVSETNFSWIDTKNDRLCNYVWSYIRSLTKEPITSAFTIDV